MNALDVITLQQAKDQLKVDFADDDALITQIISSAVNVVEQKTNWRLYQRVEIDHSDGTYNVSILQTPINSITIKTIDGTVVTWPQIKIDPIRQTIIFVKNAYNNAWASNRGFGDGLDNGVGFFPDFWGASLPLYNIFIDCGYTNTTLIPFAILQAVKTIITYMYENRDVSLDTMPNNIMMELQSYNRQPFF